MISIQVDASGIARMGNLMRAAGKQAPLDCSAPGFASNLR